MVRLGNYETELSNIRLQSHDIGSCFSNMEVVSFNGHITLVGYLCHVSIIGVVSIKNSFNIDLTSHDVW